MSPDPADTARHRRLAMLLLTCEQMDVVAADAFAAFIIVYTLSIVVVFLPINSLIKPLVFSCVTTDKLVASLILFLCYLG